MRPGELNWMTAGRGIGHSERTPPELRVLGSKLFGLQSWVALSRRDEEKAPDFTHYDAASSERDKAVEEANLGDP